MSGTITTRVMVEMEALDGKYVDSINSGRVEISQTGIGEDSFLVNVGTGSPEELDFSRLTNPGICVLRNLCPSGYTIEVGPSGSTEYVAFLKLSQYQTVPLPLKDGAKLFAQSVGSGEAMLEVKVYEQ